MATIKFLGAAQSATFLRERALLAEEDREAPRIHTRKASDDIVRDARPGDGCPKITRGDACMCMCLSHGTYIEDVAPKVR